MCPFHKCIGIVVLLASLSAGVMLAMATVVVFFTRIFLVITGGHLSTFHTRSSSRKLIYILFQGWLVSYSITYFKIGLYCSEVIIIHSIVVIQRCITEILKH